MRHEYKPITLVYKNYVARFNGNTGRFIRTSDLYTGEEVFSASFPELIDIGIMETCVCSKQCKVGCYQNAASRKGSNMSLDNYKRLMDECSGRVMQVALGGAGDPDTHENFKEILEYSAKSNIVPNFTTSGICMNDEKAELCKEYCGAVAVSEHFADYTDKAVEILLKHKVKTNIHYVLNIDTIDLAIDILKGKEYRSGINAIVFLLYKPVGLGSLDKILRVDNPKVKEFFSLIGNHKCKCKIGFDSCSCSGLVNFSDKIDYTFIDFCEGGRFSMYISSDMKAYPCSFANQSESGFDISSSSIEDAWKSFDYFRNRLQGSCLDCKNRQNCMGGCPLLSSITLCNRKERTIERGLIEK